MVKEGAEVDDVAPYAGGGSGRHGSVSVDAERIRKMSLAQPDFVNIAHDGAKGADNERNMGFLQSIKLYPKAVGWSVLLSTALVMEGYDVVLIGTFYAFPAFQRAFGVLQSDGKYQLTAAWQNGISNGAQVGEILGLFAAGVIADRFGYRKTMIGALSLVVCFIFIVFFNVNSLVQLLIGEILLGIPWGVFQTITTTYASEVCPTNLRAYLTTYVNLCWVLGQLIASGVLKAMQEGYSNSEWGYRIPFALQWMWPVPLIIGCFLAPESPWWLVRHNRIDEAKHSLRRLTSNKHGDVMFSVDDTIAMIVHTNELERSVSEGTSYWDCFKGTDLRRTEIVCVVWATQTLCGSPFMGFSTYFFEQAGMTVSNSFSMSMGLYGFGAVGTMSSWFLMKWFGRRTLYLYGQLTMVALLLIIGFLGLGDRSLTNVPISWAIGVMLLLYTFVYDSTVGPVCYSLVAELSTTRLKYKTVVLARNFYNIIGIVANIIMPRMLNPTAWGWGALSGFFWAGTCFLCAVWTFFRLPEPKGRTYGELDVLFENKVSPRKFSKTSVDQYAADGLHRDRSNGSDEKLAAKQIETGGGL